MRVVIKGEAGPKMYRYVQYSNTLKCPNIPLLVLSDTQTVYNLIQSIITQRTHLF